MPSASTPRQTSLRQNIAQLVKMRLLNVNTLKLHEFFDSDAPQYAILSHRWGNEEITFKDFMKNRNCYGPDYDKIQGFCNAVKRLDLTFVTPIEWVWLDTMCIDSKYTTPFRALLLL